MARPKSEGKRPSNEKVGFVAGLTSWIKTIIGAIIIVMFVNGALVASFVVPTGSMEGTVLAGDFVFVNKFVYGPSTPQIVPFLNEPLPFWKTAPIWAPERNDVIVFIFPGDRDMVESKEFTYYLKRCVAVGGDEVEVRENKLYVNGSLQENPELANFSGDKHYRPGSLFPRGTSWSPSNYGPITVPKEGDVVTLDADPDTFNRWNIFIQREGHDVDYDQATGTWRIDGVEAQTYTVERDYVFGMGDNRDDSLDSRFWGFVPVDNIVGTPMFVYWSWEVGPKNSNQEYPLAEKWSRLRLDRIFTGID